MYTETGEKNKKMVSEMPSEENISGRQKWATTTNAAEMTTKVKVEK